MTKKSITDWNYVLDVFDLPAEPTAEAQGLAPEHLAVPYENLDNYYTNVYEITINIPMEGLSVVEQKTVYELVWKHLLSLHKIKAEQYFIEYCKSGQMHIHGYVEMYHHANTSTLDDQYFMEMIARDIFLKLPKKYWKQQKKAVIHPFFRMYKTPAVCINIKDILSSNWLKYITKTGGETGVRLD